LKGDENTFWLETSKSVIKETEPASKKRGVAVHKKIKKSGGQSIFLTNKGRGKRPAGVKEGGCKSRPKKQKPKAVGSKGRRGKWGGPAKKGMKKEKKRGKLRTSIPRGGLTGTDTKAQQQQRN